jgi:hypothetical protein
MSGKTAMDNFFRGSSHMFGDEEEIFHSSVGELLVGML